MFNSGIIDVAIGIVFIYLLLSLITSAVNEVMELYLKNRATDLERGIRELLQPGAKPGTQEGSSELVRRLYNHPLVNGLFAGTYEDSGITRIGRFIKRTQLPSYIPSRNFALALMDLALERKPGEPSGAAGTLAPAPTTESEPLPSPETCSIVNSLKPLRDGLANNPLIPNQARQGLITLIDAAGNDAAMARDNIENWYNTSMDRVSGWYKRRSQIIILVIGVLVSFALNADSVMIAKRLVADKSLRDSLSTAAQEYAKTNANTKSPDEGAIKPTTTASSSADEHSVAEKKSWRKCPPPSCENQPGSPQCKLDKSLCDIDGLGLPIGWDAQDDPRRNWPGLNFMGDAGWFKQFSWHLLGWLITAMAITLGAPFWFDMLNKIIVVRSTVKPHEKSPEEGSKA